MMNQLPAKLFEVIKQLPYDLRAEVVLADLVERGLNPDVLLVSPKGLFKRRFSRDVEQVTVLEADKKTKFIVADVNREGIYDTLPQALTHSVKQSKKPEMKGSAEMAGEIKERRKEEQAARDFFLPFENEFYQQCITLEIAERDIIKGFLTESKYTRLMNDFWQLPALLSERQKAAFVYLVPIVYKAAGDINLTKLCYEAILGVSVNFVIKTGFEQSDPKLTDTISEDFVLGINFVCGNKFYNHSAYYEIQLGPLGETQLQEYLPGKNGRKVVDFLNSYYLPFEADNRLTILTKPVLNEFILNGPANRLAYTTCL